MLHLQFPDYRFLKSFYNTQKLDFHSKECIFLGYSSSHKGYKCLDSTGKIFISKDVIFNELRFPYPDMFPSDSPTYVKPDAPTLSTFLPAHIPIVPTTRVPSTQPTTSASSTAPPSPIIPTSPLPSQHASSGQSMSTNQSPASSHLNLSTPISSIPTDVVFNVTPITVIPPSESGSHSAQLSLLHLLAVLLLFLCLHLLSLIESILTIPTL